MYIEPVQTRGKWKMLKGVVDIVISLYILCTDFYVKPT